MGAGTARRRRANDVTPNQHNNPPLNPYPPGQNNTARKGTPTSGRHSPPKAGERRNPHPPRQPPSQPIPPPGRTTPPARERRPPVGTARQRRADDTNPHPLHDSHLNPYPPGPNNTARLERRPLASSPGGGRHRPPKAGERRKPHPARQPPSQPIPPRAKQHRPQGNADLRSAPPAAGGRTTQTPNPCTTPISTRTPPGKTTPPARERRPPVGTARQRRADDTNPHPLHDSPLSTHSTNPHRTRDPRTDPSTPRRRPLQDLERDPASSST